MAEGRHYITQRPRHKLLKSMIIDINPGEEPTDSTGAPKVEGESGKVVIKGAADDG
jgi:hypothetical protein